MTSLLDAKVHARRRAVPWAFISLKRFMDEMAENDFDPAAMANPDGPLGEWDRVTLEVMRRSDVASRRWYTLSWNSVTGARCSVQAQTLDLCLWRAAQQELDLTEAAERARKQAEMEAPSAEWPQGETPDE